MEIKEEKLISVIVPVYNASDYIERCLNSIIKSTYTKLEIICIDDGSTDHSKSIIELFENMDSRVIAIYKKNEGISKTRNLGLDIARGEYIAFVDSDDWIHEKYFQILIDTLNNQHADIVLAEHIRTGKNDYCFENKRVPDGMFNSIQINYRSFFTDVDAKYYVWGKIYRRELIGNIRFAENMQIAEDVLFNAMVLENIRDAKIIKIKNPLYVYYDHFTSTIYKYDFREKLFSFKYIYSQIEKFENETLRNGYILEIIKQCLAIRYACRICHESRNNQKYINALMKECFANISWSGKKEHFAFRIMYLFPKVYRLWRIKGDPTLLEYEKKIRASKMMIDKK